MHKDQSIDRITQKKIARATTSKTSEPTHGPTGRFAGKIFA